MSTYQEHFGRKFSIDKKTGYWISTSYSKSKNIPRLRAHQWVWINHHGKPPKGYHIHHIDEDKSNNSIENLELMKNARHLRMHMAKNMMDPIKRQIAKNQCEKIRPLAKKWHKSEEGRAWHKYHAIKHNFGNGPLCDYKCLLCGKEYKSKIIAENRTKFCSNKCKSSWRRREKIDNIEIICTICLQKFNKSKYSKQKYCSKKCGGNARRKIKI